MSTSLLVEKMKKEAEKQGIEANIWAVGANEAKANGAKADVVLLGPQVRYLEATVKKEVAPTPAQLIDMRSYGRHTLIRLLLISFINYIYFGFRQAGRSYSHYEINLF